MQHFLTGVSRQVDVNGAAGPDAQRTREDLRLQREYPGQYVAFVDIWTDREGMRLLERKVLAHDLKFGAMNDKLRCHATMASVAPDTIRTTYIEDPNMGVPDHMSIGEGMRKPVAIVA